MSCPATATARNTNASRANASTAAPARARSINRLTICGVSSCSAIPVNRRMVRSATRGRGLELEGEYQISDEWLMNFAYTHLDAKIVSNIDPDFLNYIGTNNAKGKYLPQVPANTAALGGTYQGTMANGWGLFGNGGVDYEGSRYGDATNVSWTGSSTKFNLRIGIEPVKNLRITAYVKNAFNNKTPEDILRYIDPEMLIAYPNLATGSGYSINYPRAAVVTAPMPRLFGVRLDYRF